MADINKKNNEELIEEEEPLKKPRLSPFSKIPYWIKAILIKYWFYGLYYYLVYMGIGALFKENDVTSTIIMLIIFCFFGGILNDLILSGILIVLERKPNEHKPFVIYKKEKSVISSVINVIYGFIWGTSSVLLTGLIATNLPSDWTWFGREPLTFALFALAIDMVFVGIKDLIVYLVKKQKMKD